MLKYVVFIIRNQLFIVKDLRKIIAVFIFTFVIGTTVTLFSINKKLDKKNPQEIVKVSKDSSSSFLRDKKTV